MVRGAGAGRGRPRGRGRGVASASTPTTTEPIAPTADMAIDEVTQTPSTVPSEPAATNPSLQAPTQASNATALSREAPKAAAASSSRGRLRPKVVRRNEEEREKLAQQEAKKDSERAAEERRLRGRVRFRGRRGRGSQFNTTGPRLSKAEPSGLFADQRGVPGSSRGGFGFGGSGRGGFMGGGAGRGRGNHQFEGTERPWEVRINTDKLGSSTPSAQDAEDAEEEEMAFMAVHSQPGRKPLGITRKEVKEAETVVVTAAELEAQMNEDDDDEVEDLWVGDAPKSPAPVPKPDDKVWSAAPEDHVRIKTEDGQLHSFIPPSSGAVDFDAMRNVPLPEGTAAAVDLKEPVGATGSRAPSVVGLEGSKPPRKAKKSAGAPTEEEEWKQDSYAYILQTLAAASLQDEDEAAKEEGDDGGAAREATNALNDPMPFLCKFGPIIPPLRPKARPEPLIKNEPTDTVMLDQPSAVDLTAEQQGGSATEASEGEDQAPFAHSGFIGKLVIRKSGKAELDFGGIRYQMSRGIKSSGVTSYMVLEESETKKPGQDEYAGRAIAMGTLLGKFNFGPVYNEQKEWIVTEEDLKPPKEEDNT